MNAPVERGLADLLVSSETAGQRFLMPGDWWFGADAGAVSTLLGSCVAVTLWHPQRQLGGMCHFLVPARVRASDDPLDGRYGEEALLLLRQSVTRAMTLPSDYRVMVFGGANMFPGVAAVTLDVGARNAEIALEGLARHGFMVTASDLGGTRHRRIELEVATGRVRVRAGA